MVKYAALLCLARSCLQLYEHVFKKKKKESKAVLPMESPHPHPTPNPGVKPSEAIHIINTQANNSYKVNVTGKYFPSNLFGMFFFFFD